MILPPASCTACVTGLYCAASPFVVILAAPGYTLPSQFGAMPRSSIAASSRRTALGIGTSYTEEMRVATW